MSDQPSRRRKDSAKLVWDTKPKRAPNPRDIEFQTAEIVIPNPKQEQGSFDLPLLNLAGSNLPFNQVGTQDIDKSKMNRLIWGDNLLAMQALLAQGYAGKIDLIYIDPPFLSSADYSFQLSIEGQQVTKEASIIERLAYTDTWEGGMDSFLDMIYPRLQLMKRLLSDKGSIFIHLDNNVGHYVKLILDEVFGIKCFQNEVVWQRTDPHNDAINKFGNIHDIIFWYGKQEKPTYYPDAVRTDLSEAGLAEYSLLELENGGIIPYKGNELKKGRRFKLENATWKGSSKRFKWRGVQPSANREWMYDYEGMESALARGELYLRDLQKGSTRCQKKYLDENQGILLQDIWTDTGRMKGGSDYPTKKPEKLLERIIKASSNEGDLVADFFCGSGTTMAVAERLGRRWIGCNLDKVGLQVSRNRMVEQGAKPFLMENIGNYQRHMIYLSGSKIGEMQRIMLKLYGADPRTDRTDLGVRRLEDGTTELVYVGYPDRPVTARKVIELAQDAEILDGTGYKTLVILAWDYDYNYSTEYESRIKKQALKVNVKALTIPPEIYNYLKKAKSEADLDGLRDKITFHEKPYVKISKPQVQDAGNGMVIISLSIDRYVLMNLPIPEKQQAELRKVIKDNFAALIDYWAVDWDYDGITFRSTWQAIRGNGKRASTVITTAQSTELPSKKRTIAVRLVDVFGNDASVITNIL
ncbi:site-specific DNA-methyltransferase [Synechococcus sp. PCC 6312]|uniref:site-specific DNA-methyltransferase n=1 Tax=Synechococcus sp. (strain ATCC 27167 / PCC 6312) TaxID=195253 RepID=UPI00029F35E8|nr:site-specific DNA-methyltransferase [Synechococcus sp. PCC 6312]AFY61835.1 adenine specific DNA methylase Mod [Synechococcus sp. PCC 6312]